MWYLRRIDPYDSLVKGRFIAFVGAGGKTSLCEYLAAEALRRGRRVALVTTTKIWAREPFVATGSAGWRGSHEPYLHIGKTLEGRKLTALGADEVGAIGGDFDLVLIEADGSKNKPLKYPADFEPVIPDFSDHVVVVAGLDSLGGRIDEKVFRWELFAAKTGLSGDDTVSTEVFLRLIENDGMMKGVDEKRCTVVLNKYDACGEGSEVRDIAAALTDRCQGRPVIAGSTRFGFFYGFEQLSVRPPS